MHLVCSCGGLGSPGGRAGGWGLLFKDLASNSSELYDIFTLRMPLLPQLLVRDCTMFNSVGRQRWQQASHGGFRSERISYTSSFDVRQRCKRCSILSLLRSAAHLAFLSASHSHMSLHLLLAVGSTVLILKSSDHAQPEPSKAGGLPTTSQCLRQRARQ